MAGDRESQLAGAKVHLRAWSPAEEPSFQITLVGQPEFVGEEPLTGNDLAGEVEGKLPLGGQTAQLRVPGTPDDDHRSNKPGGRGFVEQGNLHNQ